MFGEKFKKKYALTDAGVACVKKGVAWTIVVNLLMFAGMAALWVLMGQLMDALVAGGDLPALVPYLVAVAALLALSAAAHLMQYRNTYGTVYGEVRAVRLGIAERLRVLPLSFFSGRDLADLSETIMSDVDRLEHVWSHVLSYLYGSYVTSAIAALACLFYDWRLMIAAFWSIPVAFALLFGSHRHVGAAALRLKERTLELADGVQELLEGAREIRATNQEGRYLEGVFAQADAVERSMTSGEAFMGIIVNAAQAIMRLGVAATVLAGATLILAGDVEFMVLFMFLLLVTRIYAPFDQALALIAELFVSENSAERIQGIYDEPAATGGRDFAPAGYDVAFEDVGFAYGSRAGQVLDGVSFVAREGEVTALVGPSGSGKSTCARLAARLWDATSGTVRVGGVDVASVEPEVLLGAFSMVFQDVTLFDDTVMENIRLGRRGATDEEVLAAARAANCDDFVSELAEGYQTVIGENGSRLSGGERQRISIARALLKNAPILLLDEATASLDVESETEVQAALSRLLAGKTVLVIAHRMRTIANADHVVVLDGGRVVEDGAPSALLAQDGTFARMVALQSQSAGWSL